jgi:hypothetical protein
MWFEFLESCNMKHLTPFTPIHTKSRHFSDVRQHSSLTCLSSPKRVRPARHDNRPARHRFANGKPGDYTTHHDSATAG